MHALDTTPSSRVSTRSVSAIALLGAFLVVAAGCEHSDPAGGDGIAITQQSATGDANQNVRAALLLAADGIAFLGDLELMESLWSSDESDCDESDCGEPTGDFDLTDEAHDAADWVAENIFNAGNVETSTGTSVTCLIPAELLCGQSASYGYDDDVAFPDGEGGSSESEIDFDMGTDDADPECLDTFRRFPIRLRLSSPREGDLDVALLVGPSRINPVDLRLYRDQLSVEVDIEALRAALLSFADVADVELELPEVMRGRIAGSLIRLGEAQFRVSGSILSPIDVQSRDGELDIAISLAAADPAMTVDFDGAAQTIDGAIALGALSATLPAEAVFGDEMSCDMSGDCVSTGPSGPVEIALGGLSAAVSLAGLSERIELRSVGLGDTTSRLSLNGEQLLGIDLNATAGRQMDLTVESRDGTVELSVTPQMDLVVDVDLAPVADSLSDAPLWMMNEVLGITLDGSPSPRIALVDGSPDDVIEVLEGTLRLTSAARDLLIEVTAGECLWAESNSDGGGLWPDDELDGDDDWHPFDGLLSGLCPE